MQHSEGSLTTSDGLRLFHQAWTPDGDPATAVMLIHGLAEHSGRYAHVAATLVEAGCAVHALDLRGHGRSQGKRSYVKSYDDFMGDLVVFRRHVESAHPGRPLIVLGHSMGGNLAVGHVLDHQDGVAGLALSGAALKIGDDFSAAQIKIFKVMARIAPGFRPQALSAAAISRDPAVVQAYLDDPLVYNGKIAAGLGAALFDAIERFPARYRELRMPVLIMHGTEDQLADIGGSRALEAGAVNADVTVHYYDGLYHEIFNEPEHAQVLGDLVAWIGTVSRSATR
jgi:alpha-beta hydrolase superfamily lysophospholipase